MNHAAQPPDPLAFLNADPLPVVPAVSDASLEPQGLRLPQSTIDALMAVKGVQGVWVEGAAADQAVVVVHVDASWKPYSVARQINGWPVRIDRGGPIKAL